MTYGYENLGDERFQQLCQAILTTVYNDVQCLPVGQPDGGRDALLRPTVPHSRVDSVVFQVKFSKVPDTKNERIVIEELIKTESEKINKLKARGLERYYLITNVSGTSHYDSGSIDRVNDQLSLAFNVQAYCWWRDDIDRRMDTNSSIKWSFPDILRGSDLLQFLYEGKFGGEESRRLAAIKAYLAYQYKYDSQLKFKQVDLEKGLVDLFVDVPAGAVGPANARDRVKWHEKFERSQILARLVNDNRPLPRRDEEDLIGAVRVLADPLTAAALPRVVIEGAPGQGKSTVTQFLCQLHRMLLLKKTWEIRKVPAELFPTNVRLPLRVDLRDYATWLSGSGPFQDANTQTAHGGLSPSLEAFLAAQISTQSGGLQFSPDDLLAFAANSALLIVLDGFDEIADIATRNRIVREVDDASTRLEGNTISNQIIVTSRPAAFANSPGFSRDEWQYIQILPLTKKSIINYTEKWMSGHNLDRKERSDLTSVLSEKLEYPHVRELARNPMQLAILLALISTQGASLPDKRTILYDRYIDIFFNRESEKSKVVRDKRDLLIAMHRYLAWTLQVEAESSGKAGNISEQRLREVLRGYLTETGHNAALVDDLFTGMVERVVALVARVQGTFEFEVQPLREYFAARYLYDTAPHVQAGSSRSGSIMDRFDALARNAYWLNVTRFYCGCYSSGELPSLVDGIVDIGQSEQYMGTSDVGRLALTLLADYVFSQQPHSVKRLTTFLVEKNRFMLLLANTYVEGADREIVLPEESGRETLLSSAVSTYRTANHFDTAFASGAVVKANLGSESSTEIWNRMKNSFPVDEAIYFASFLNALENMPEFELLDLVEKGGSKALRLCVYSNRADVLNLRPELWRRFTELLLDGRVVWLAYPLSVIGTGNFDASCMRLLVAITGAISILRSEDLPENGRTLLRVARRFGYPGPNQAADVCRSIDEGDHQDSVYKEVTAAACVLVNQKLSRTPVLERSISLFLELMLEQFGHRSIIIDAAIVGFEWFSRGPELVEHTGVLAMVANMRSCSHQPEWWRERFASASDQKMRFLLSKLFLAWADNRVLCETICEFSELLDQLPYSDFYSLYEAGTGAHSPYPSSQDRLLKPGFTTETVNNAGVRAAALWSTRVDSVDRDLVFKAILEAYDGCDKAIIGAQLDAAWDYAGRNQDFWPSAIEKIANGYARGVEFNPSHQASERVQIPLLEAKRITQSPDLFPLSVVGVAERALAEKTGTQVIPVGSVAARDQWFL